MYGRTVSDEYLGADERCEEFLEEGAYWARGSNDRPYAQDQLTKVLRVLNADDKKGLSTVQVLHKQKTYGFNKLDEEEKKSLFSLVLAQFDDKLVKILLASACVSFALAFFDAENKEEGLGAYVEPIVILAILVLNAFVGVWQESSAEAALDALKKLAADKAFTLRNGVWMEIDAEELVPGDIVEVKTGDKVPADIRLLHCSSVLKVEQSQLTGESESVTKEAVELDQANADITSQKNMLFSSTTISTGSATGVVVATGMRAEIGKIQEGVQEAAKDDDQTPLQKKLDEFGDQLAKLILMICVLVWVINYKHFADPKHGSTLRGCIYYFKIAVALAVAAIPEGLPTVITMCLAIGTRKMAKKNCIVRKLPSVETLGCTTVICSDKTGTLTTNQMCVVKCCLPTRDKDLKEYTVDGTTYTPVGRINGLSAIDWSKEHALSHFAKVGALCNKSRLLVEDGEIKRNGEPTEAAIRVFVEKLGCPDPRLQCCWQKPNRTADEAEVFSNYWRQGLTQRAVLEFSHLRKSMGVIYDDPSLGGNVLYVKGAPEEVLKRCTKIMLPDGSQVDLTEDWKTKVNNEIKGMAMNALRTIGMAFRPSLKGTGLETYDGTQDSPNKSHRGYQKLLDSDNFAALESDMVFLGMVGILDPPRPECRQAIQECRDAGISVIMITGDNKNTAEAIALKLGILATGGNHKENSFTGQEFDALKTDAERAEDKEDTGDRAGEKQVEVLRKILARKATEGAVFSRTEPRHKQMIIKALKQLDEVTAMTGDGVNDAPALKQADIGVAMGITGTEVAKDASAMILQDDKFSTIVAAVEEGRSIYSNMKAFIRYMISSNIGEVASIFFTAALGIPEGLTPVQLLWVNLVTDGPPATALGLNPPDMDVMKKEPRRKDDKLISTWSLVRYLVIGFYVGCAVVGIFIYWFVFNTDDGPLVSLDRLMRWGECSQWEDFSPPRLTLPFGIDGPITLKEKCDYFTDGKIKASTLSLTVLVVIEMLNAFNALSEDGSLVSFPPWKNPYLIAMTILSIASHMVVVYIPMMNKIFGVCPLSFYDWQLVMAFSFPVILIDEVLKLVGRSMAKKNKLKVSPATLNFFPSRAESGKKTP